MLIAACLPRRPRRSRLSPEWHPAPHLSRPGWNRSLVEFWLLQCWHGSKRGNRGEVRNGVFYTVHHIVSSPVEPARLISPSCHRAGTRPGTRHQIAQAGPPRAGGLRHRLDLALRAQSGTIWKFLGIFFPRAVNDLDPFSRRIVMFALTKFGKHCTVRE
jgi:hypothetical protein